MQTLQDLFKTGIEKFSNHPAYSYKPKWRTIRWTFKMLENYASKIASILEEKNIGYQDRVIIISGNAPFWGGAFFGSILRGCIIVPLNPQSTDNFIERIVAETEAKIIFKASYIKIPKNISIPIITIDFLSEFAKTPTKFSQVNLSETDIAEIVYTSGTTGEPKGVVLTHKNIMSNVTTISKIFYASPKDRTVSVLPLFHMYEQTGGLFTALSFGIETMYSNGVSSREIRECLQKQKATKMLVVPELLETIIRRVEDKAAEANKLPLLEKLFNFSSKLPYFIRRIIFRKIHKELGGKLTMFGSGGAALPAEIHRKWDAVGIKVLQGYGLTETSPLVSTNTFDIYKFGSVGKVIPQVTVKISDDREIRVSGPNVFSGYYHNQERTKEVFDEEGYFKTGDLGYFDNENFLFINGRKKYMILSSSGENIYPEDIEAEIKKVKGVVDAAVVGIKVDGREIVHAVLLGNFENPAKVIEIANKHLAQYQKIIDWSVWPEADFPRSATRKVKKEEVIAWINSGKEKAEKNGAPVQISPLIAILSNLSSKKIHQIQDSSNLTKDLHFDSLLRIELVGRLEEKFDVVIEEQEINHDTTVADLKKLIAQAKKRPPQRKLTTWYLKKPIRIFSDYFMRIFAFPFYSWFLKFKVEGLENVTNLTSPFILMPNHVSYSDAVLILKALPAKLRRKIAIAAAVDFMYQEYWYVAWLLEIIFNTYPFPRKEEENIKPGLIATGEILDRDFSIMLFPEGKISVSGQLLPLKQGAGLLATEMNVPVIPVIITGIQNAVPKDKVVPRHHGEVRIKFGTPITFGPEIQYQEATKIIQDAMKKLIS